MCVSGLPIPLPDHASAALIYIFNLYTAVNARKPKEPLSTEMMRVILSTYFFFLNRSSIVVYGMG